MEGTEQNVSTNPVAPPPVVVTEKAARPEDVKQAHVVEIPPPAPSPPTKVASLDAFLYTLHKQITVLTYAESGELFAALGETFEDKADECFDSGKTIISEELDRIADSMKFAARDFKSAEAYIAKKRVSRPDFGGLDGMRSVNGKAQFGPVTQAPASPEPPKSKFEETTKDNCKLCEADYKERKDALFQIAVAASQASKEAADMAAQIEATRIVEEETIPINPS